MTVLAETMVGCAVLLKMSLTSQWQFWSSLLKMSLIGQWQFRITVGLSQNIVIDWSMTIFNSNFKIVIDLWMTVLHYSWVITENCHWPVNDNFEAVYWKLSLTGQWQFWRSPLSSVLRIRKRRKLSLTSQWQFLSSLLKTVFDRSLTIFEDVFCRIRNR